MSREVVCVKVLDLDETLVHCSVEPIVGADLTFPVEFNGVNYTVYVRKRPHLHRLLEAIRDKFEVVVFTASQKVYADRLLNLLDPEGKYFR
jgi:CTD small phosphatase-like protein 2